MFVDILHTYVMSTGCTCNEPQLDDVDLRWVNGQYRLSVICSKCSRIHSVLDNRLEKSRV
jgi:hypothetical protein